MLVFIDESGDAGFKVGSSPNLVMALVIFDDYEQADATRSCIVRLMQETGVRPEYKFSGTSDRHKTLFFETMQSCSFRVCAIVMRKHRLHSDFLRKNPDKFYNYTLKNLITGNGIADARIRIDGKGNKLFVRAAKSYLRSQVPPGTIASLRFLDSRAEPLIQLCDMVTGAIARAANRPGDPQATQWQRFIQKRIKNIWDFS